MTPKQKMIESIMRECKPNYLIEHSPYLEIPIDDHYREEIEPKIRSLCKSELLLRNDALRLLIYSVYGFRCKPTVGYKAMVDERKRSTADIIVINVDEDFYSEWFLPSCVSIMEQEGLWWWDYDDLQWCYNEAIRRTLDWWQSDMIC